MSQPVRELITVGDVCARLPGSRGAKRVSPSSITRWILNGCPARTGERVKLRATRAGGRWLIDPEDLKAFFDRLGAEPPDTATSATQVPYVPDASEQAERARRSVEKLKASGA